VSTEGIHSAAVPAPVGPYSQAVRAGNLLFISGQIAVDPATGELQTEAGAAAQRVLSHIEALVEAAGGSRRDIVKVSVFLTDLGDFAAVNAVFEGFFAEPFPARETVEVKALPKGATLEISATAYLGT